MIENQYFKPLTKTFTFAENPKGKIKVENVFHHDEYNVDYVLVPAKKNEQFFIEFTLEGGINEYNRFLIFTEYLDPYTNDELTELGIQPDGKISEYTGETGSSGRVLLYEPIKDRCGDCGWFSLVPDHALILCYARHSLYICCRHALF